MMHVKHIFHWSYPPKSGVYFINGKKFSGGIYVTFDMTDPPVSRKNANTSSAALLWPEPYIAVFFQYYFTVWAFLTVWIFSHCYCHEQEEEFYFIPDSLADTGLYKCKIWSSAVTSMQIAGGVSFKVQLFLYTCISKYTCLTFSHSPAIEYPLFFSFPVGKINISNFKIWAPKTSVIIHTEVDLKSPDHRQILSELCWQMSSCPTDIPCCPTSLGKKGDKKGRQKSM